MDNDLFEILKELGISDPDELFDDIPQSIRTSSLGLPRGMTEDEIRKEALKLTSMNRTVNQMHSFLGFGLYNHYVPAAIGNIISRNEFLTSYTPYQPEISQGIMQALFEYQSVMAELLQMDVVNSSLYDSSTSLGEAIRMAGNITGKKEFLIPARMYETKKMVISNYVKGSGIRLKEYPFDGRGMADLLFIRDNLNENTAGIYVEYPNMFGIIDENVRKVKEIIGQERIFVAGVNPISLGVLSPPGSLGADIVVGEGQVLGLGLNFGGPLLGIFATRMEYVRKVPGRIIGAAEDENGKPAFAMILQTREQHIRREKAISNITSNEALMSIASLAYLSLLGDSGMKRIGEINMGRTQKLMDISREFGVKLPYAGSPVFNEFLLNINCSRTFVAGIAKKLDLIPGYYLGKEYGFSNRNEVNLVVNVTERNTDEDFDAYREFLGKVS
ncbi:MAG: aminomethyl-transferring glycine dehydrogenase subunit GcvPA [Candidatus Thermoplasmatota archaeon]|jgi:glycine dehydrogenase subunit 1|nr:aminomethyl-transferring glycine dehydrogenase subunit GcvPA [Candidatus Thermoplasmatota archaeon]